MSERKQVDWEKVEAEYRAGSLSIREIARQYDVSAPRIVQKAKALGWERDLSGSFRGAVNAKLVKETASVNGDVNGLNARQTVEAAAARGVEVVRGHRQDISVGRSMVALLLGQLHEAATNRDAIEEAIYDETRGDENLQRRNQMLRAVSLPAHAGVVKDLSAALKNLIPLERQAFNLDAAEDPDDDRPQVKIYIPSNGRD